MNPHKRRVILVLEDNPAVRIFYIDSLNPKGYEVLCSPSMKGALQLFDEERENIVGVISDGNVIEGDFGPIFVERLRNFGFKGPIIATSMSSALRQKLIRAGCSEKADEKKDAPQTLLRAIQTTQTLPT
ncbi:response regulator [Candidatus Uhrbacteria bacterium]|nr:response regulator [Candidatus Uhrbacteria bacterium]